MYADGDYVLETLDVTTPLLPHQGDGRTRDIITAVNTNMESQSILWEKVRLAPRVTEPTYDLAGNMTSDGRISYTWNAANQLLSCEDEDFHIDFHAILRRRTEYVYDAESRRIEKRDYARTAGGNWELFATTQYLYDGWDIVAAYVTTGNVTTTHMYVHGVDISGTMGGAGGVGGLLMGAHRITGDTLVREQYIYDSQGNVRHKVRVGAGAPSISATYEYDPYGRLLYADPPPAYEVAPQFLFSTKLYESHWQQYYYGYRYYSPDTGCWHSRDPIGERGGINFYGFVGNNPLMFVDSLGLMSARSRSQTANNGQSAPSFCKQSFDYAVEAMAKHMTYMQNRIIQDMHKVIQLANPGVTDIEGITKLAIVEVAKKYKIKGALIQSIANVHDIYSISVIFANLEVKKATEFYTKYCDNRVAYYELATGCTCPPKTCEGIFREYYDRYFIRSYNYIHGNK